MRVQCVACQRSGMMYACQNGFFMCFSASTSNTDALYRNPPLHNEHPPRLIQKSRLTATHQPFTVSGHQSHSLSRRQVHNISTARLSAAAQRRLFQLTSFSRGLSIHPLDALKDYASHQRAKLSVQPYLADHKSSGWREMGDDVSGLAVDPIKPPPLRKLESLNLQAAGRMTYLHARSSRQERQKRQKSCSEHSQVPSRRVARGARDIVIPLQTENLTKSPCTVTLRLDPSLEHHSMSHRSREAKIASRFLSVPKSHYTPSCNRPLSFSEDIPSTGDSTQLLARGQSSRLSNSHSAGITKHSILQHLSSPSPDYMLVAANFAEGQLILTDKEGVVTQHLTTEVEEEPNGATGLPITQQDTLTVQQGVAIQLPQDELTGRLNIQQDRLNVQKDRLNVQQDRFNVQQNVQQDRLNVQQDKLTLQQNESTTQQDESVVQQDELIIQQDELTVQQDELTLQQDEVTIQQDELTIQQDKSSVGQDKTTIQQDESSIHQDESLSNPNKPAVELTLQQTHCTPGQEVPDESSALNLVPPIPAGIRAPPPSAVEEMRRN